MKNIKTFCCVALVAALAVLSCGDGSENTGEKTLTGKVQIFLGEIPAAEFAYDINTGSELTADYSGDESVSFQWKKDGANVAANKGGTAKIITLGEPGKYTVTASAKGYKSKTSASVTVKGDAIPPLSGEVRVFKKGTTAPITAAQTGEELTAFYDGAETVSFQWFKDGEPVTTYASSNFKIYAPPKTGTYTVKASFGGYTPKFSNPVTVIGQNKIIITFDLNGLSGPPAPDPIVVDPNTAVGTLPTAPERDGYTFMGWSTAPDGDALVTEESTFSADIKLFAVWRNDTYVIENPVMEQGSIFTGTIAADGTISFTNGSFQYKFPTDIDLSEYAYFIVRFELTSGDGNISGVKLIQYGTTDTVYGGVSNEYPWLSNTKNTGIQFPVSGGGGGGGFGMKWGGQSGTAIVVKITSITLYKLPEYTVTFNLNGGQGTIPSIKVYKGFTIGTANFPASPTMADYSFVGWNNADGDSVNATTPITGDWELTAQWIPTSQAIPVEVEAAANGTLFSAVGSYASETTGIPFTYGGKDYWIVSNAQDGDNYKWTAAIAPFDGDDSAIFTQIQTAQTSYGGENRGYTRIAFDVSTITDELSPTSWDSYTKVTITYDLVSVGGNGLNVQFRNSSTTASGTEFISNTGTALTAGTNQTLTFDISLIKNAAPNRNGWIGIVKSQTGALLLRISKVTLHY